MAKFSRHSGDSQFLPYKKTASTAFAIGDPVKQTSGLLVKAGASDTPETVIGLIQRNVTASDEDYAKTSDVIVEVPGNEAVYVAEVGAGTPAQSMVGQRYDLDANGKVDLTSQTNKVVEVVRLDQDSSKIFVKFVTN